MNGAWQDYVRQRFPAYLFPSAQQVSLSVTEAERFLQHFAGKEGELELVTTASLFAAPDKRRLLRELVHRTAPELARNLPSSATIHTRIWDGAYRGRLDIARTLAWHAAGQPTRFETRDRRRTYELPQTVLVRAILERLHTGMRQLRAARISARESWGSELLDAEPAVRDLLTRTPLQHVGVDEIGPVHVHAASVAKHPAYAQALQWHRWFELARGSAQERAMLLAAGALLPLDPERRFEIAVLVRLIEAFRTRLPTTWKYECSAIISGREEVARFVSESGTTIEIAYNQARFETRARDQLLERYFGAGRMRPDITVVVRGRTGPPRAIVIEVKRSLNDDYLRQGLEEALFYRYELESHLIDRPKSILVTEKSLPLIATSSDEVVGIGWDQWPQDYVLDAAVRATSM